MRSTYQASATPKPQGAHALCCEYEASAWRVALSLCHGLPQLPANSSPLRSLATRRLRSQFTSLHALASDALFCSCPRHASPLLSDSGPPPVPAHPSQLPPTIRFIIRRLTLVACATVPQLLLVNDPALVGHPSHFVNFSSLCQRHSTFPLPANAHPGPSGAHHDHYPLDSQSTPLFAAVDFEKYTLEGS